jgi:hypothetical protein
VFDSSPINRLLSAAWVVRKRNLEEPDFLVYYHGLTREEAEFVVRMIADECYSHEDFYHHLKANPQAFDIKIRLDRAS